MSLYVLQNQTVTPIYPNGYQTVLTIINTSPYPAIVGQDPMCADQIQLTPGSSIAWDANRPLYAIADTPYGATINAYPNQGLVTTGAVVNGQPDTLLFSGVGPTPVISPMIDVSLFNGLVIVTNTGAGTVTGSTNFLTVKWYLADGITLIDRDDYYPPPPQTPTLYGYPTITTPVLASKVQITFAGPGGSSGQVGFNMFGTSRNISEAMNWLSGYTFYDDTGLAPSQIPTRRGGSIQWDTIGYENLWINSRGRHLTLTVSFDKSITTQGSIGLVSHADAMAASPLYILEQTVAVTSGVSNIVIGTDVPFGTLLLFRRLGSFVTASGVTVTAVFAD